MVTWRWSNFQRILQFNKIEHHLNIANNLIYNDSEKDWMNFFPISRSFTQLRLWRQESKQEKKTEKPVVRSARCQAEEYVWKSFDIKLLLTEKLWNLADLDSPLSPEEQLSGPLLRRLVNMDKMWHTFHHQPYFRSSRLSARESINANNWWWTPDKDWCSNQSGELLPVARNPL